VRKKHPDFLKKIQFLLSLITDIGDYCRLTSNCAVSKTTCQQGQCICHHGYHPSWDRTRCIKSIKLNNPCYSDEECVTKKSQCLNHVCRCKSSHVPSDDNQCLPLATALYQPCQHDSQCTSIQHSYCGDNSTCICLSDHHDINSVRIINNSSTSDDEFVTFEISFNFFQHCWSSVRLNGICESDENCVTAHSSCKNKHCSCDDGFEEKSNRVSKFCSNAERVQISYLVLVFLISLAIYASAHMY
jgi:EB module